MTGRLPTGVVSSIETFWIVRAKHVVLATGAIEQPLMFGNNDLPGIMQAGAMLRYARDYGVHCGDRIVAVVNNNLAWQTILDLRDAGVNVTSIIDCRADVEGDLIAGARERDIVVHCRCDTVAGTRLEQHQGSGCPYRGWRQAESRLRCPCSLRRIGTDRASVFPGRRQTALRR